MRGEQTFTHDLFKASIGMCKKNMSYKFGEPIIKDVEHVHWFHTFNSQGRPQKFTNIVGGHFHEVIWLIDDNGSPVAQCGPALHKIVKTMKNGKKRKVTERVSWYDGTEGAENRDEKVSDDHAHDMQYVMSEEINANTIRKAQNANAAKLIAANEQAVSGRYEDAAVKMTPA